MFCVYFFKDLRNAFFGDSSKKKKGKSKKGKAKELVDDETM